MSRRRALLLLLLFQGVSGVAGGLALVLDPSGGALGMSIERLRGAVFRDYLWPGVVLLGVLGVGALVAAYGVWTRRRWAGLAALLVGVGLVVWIGVQIAIVGYQPSPPLQLAYGLVGVVIAALALAIRPSVGRLVRGWA